MNNQESSYVQKARDYMVNPMPNKLSIFYGAQWGSEGKGQFAAAIAENSHLYDNVAALRVGSVNAGHTMTTAEGEQYCTQLIPCAAFTNPEHVDAILGAACLVEFGQLADEIDYLDSMCDRLGVRKPRIFVDEQQGVVTHEDHQQEVDINLESKIGSTAEGVGAATSNRVMRSAPRAVDYFNDHLRNNDPELYEYLKDRIEFVDSVHMIGEMSEQHSGQHLILEGTQGALLSLYTSGFYPFTTSRQCDPYSMMGQAGTNPKVWDECDIVAVCRTFPIRVGGNSGDLPGEVTWDYMREVTDGYIEEPETTSVTGRNRRIAELDMDYLRDKSFVPHTPDYVCLSFMDYVDPDIAGVQNWDQLSEKAFDFIAEFERTTDVPVRFVSTAAGNQFVIENPRYQNAGDVHAALA